MKAKLTRSALFRVISQVLQRADDPRDPNAPNYRYPVEQAGMTALGAFFFQHSTLAAHERALEQSTYQENFKKLFFHSPMRCSQTVRNILDPIAPSHFRDAFSGVLNRLERSAMLPALRFNSEIGLLICGDGVDYYKSTEVSCANCSKTVHNRGKENEQTCYSHKMFNVGIAHPSEKIFIPLAPEFISPQDGSTKQDCEQAAAHRWLKAFRARHKHIRATMQVDNLHANHVFLSEVVRHRFGYIAAFKEKGNVNVAKWLETARKGGDVKSFSCRTRVNKKPVKRQIEYMNDIPIRDTDDALRTNYVSMIETDLSTGRSVTFAYLTSHTVNRQNAESIIEAGRKRWRVENESHNILKNHGYYFEHNYGHGKQHLSTVIATLIVYCFLIHTILRLVGQDGFASLLQLRDARKRVMERLRNVMFILPLEDWDELYAKVRACWNTS